jgi:hypothetical protein
VKIVRIAAAEVCYRAPQRVKGPHHFQEVTMPTYSLFAKVDQIVTKEVKLQIVAGSEEEAEAKAREALQTYPEPVTVKGVDRILTSKSHYWIPRSIEFVKISEAKEASA